MNDLLDALAAARRRVHSGENGDAIAVRPERTGPAAVEVSLQQFTVLPGEES